MFIFFTVCAYSRVTATGAVGFHGNYNTNEYNTDEVEIINPTTIYDNPNSNVSKSILVVVKYIVTGIWL